MSRFLTTFAALAIAAAAILAGGTVAQAGVIYTWDGNGNLGAGGDWNVANNWDKDSGFPNALDDTAKIGADFTGDVIIDLETAISLGQLDIGDTTSAFKAVKIQKGAGAGSLTFAAGATINSSGTTNTIGNNTNVPITLNGNLTITTSSSLNWYTTGTVTGTGTIEKLGAEKIECRSGTFGGTWKVTQGILTIYDTGYSRIIKDSGNVILNGGTLSHRLPAGYTDFRTNMPVTLNDVAGNNMAFTSNGTGTDPKIVFEHEGKWTGGGSVLLTGGDSVATMNVFSLINTTNDFGGVGKSITLQNTTGQALSLLARNDGALGNVNNAVILDVTTGSNSPSAGLFHSANSTDTPNVTMTMPNTRAIQLTKAAAARSYRIATSNNTTLDIWGVISDTGAAAVAGNLTINATTLSDKDTAGDDWLSGTHYWNPGSGSTVIFSGDNTYAGATTVSAGTLLVNGSLSSGGGTVTVNSGATLGGTGTINRAVTINDGGTLAPGASIGPQYIVGNVLIPGDLLIDVDADATGDKIDLLAITGDLNLTGGELKLVGDLPDADPAYTFLTYTGGLTGTFDKVYWKGTEVFAPTEGGIGDGLTTYKLVYESGGSGSLKLELVPEPATLGLMALGGAAMVLLRRRRR